MRQRSKFKSARQLCSEYLNFSSKEWKQLRNQKNVLGTRHVLGSLTELEPELALCCIHPIYSHHSLEWWLMLR